MERYKAEHLLPKVGDKLRKAPTIVHLRGLCQEGKVQECEVVEVNRAHLWYRVKFKESGFTECYKVPALPTDRLGGIRV